MKEKLNVALVGATGIVGQQFLVSLDSHPWFRVSKPAPQINATEMFREMFILAS